MALAKNTGDGARPTSSNSDISTAVNVTDGLGLVSLSPTACDSPSSAQTDIIAQLFPARVSQDFLCLLSSSPRLSLL